MCILNKCKIWTQTNTNQPSYFSSVFLSYDTGFFWAFDEYEGFWNFIAQKQGSLFWRFLSKNIDNRQTITTLFWTYLFMSSFCYTFRLKDIMYVFNESKTQTWAKKALTQCTRKGPEKWEREIVSKNGTFWL